MYEQDVKQIDQEEREKLTQQFEELKIKLLDIENGNAYIYGELNEEYDDWYDNGEEFLYEDNYEIGQIVEECIEFVNDCIDIENYQEGYEIAKRVVNLRIKVEN